MIWDDTQLARVRGLRSAMVVDDIMAARSAIDVREGVRHLLAGQFVAEARVYAVEVHPEDLVFAESVDAFHPHYTKITVAWRPRTRVVELVGGPADGNVYELRVLGPVHIKSLVPIGPIYTATPDTAPAELVPTYTTTYEEHGWHEQERRWIYTVGGR